MQYFEPKPDFYVGDCMPFWHDGVFHFFYLLDEGHHQGLAGQGGHQWAHASSRDLRDWEHHPLALAITQDWERSICTGSVIFHDGMFHAFYALRKPDWSQHLGHARSRDGIHFEMQDQEQLMAAPPGITRNNFRDPAVFRNEQGLFQMLMTAQYADFPLQDRGGFLLRMTSPDLETWNSAGPFLIPGGGAGYDSIPECPDYFAWKDWHYLVFGSGLRTRYRMSRHSMGPWLRPANDMLGSALNSVMKTAPFGTDRRIGASWIGCRQGDKDGGAMTWGGHALFRELVQNPDGTLGTKFPEEMIPATGPRLEPVFHALLAGCTGSGSSVELEAGESQVAGFYGDLPQDFRLRSLITPQAETRVFGLGLRGSGNFGSHYDLRVDCGARRLSLRSESIPLEGDLGDARRLDVIVRGDIIDVCLDGRQTLVNRCPELKGDRLFFYCENGAVKFEEIDLRPL